MYRHCQSKSTTCRGVEEPGGLNVWTLRSCWRYNFVRKAHSKPVEVVGVIDFKIKDDLTPHAPRARLKAGLRLA
jgi:hypothetical protein